MRKVNQKPTAEIELIVAKESFDTRFNFANGKVYNRKAVTTVPVKQLDKSEKKGYRKYQLQDGPHFFFNISKLTDKKINSSRIYRTVIFVIDEVEYKLKFVQFTENAVSRPIAENDKIIAKLKELLPDHAARLDWTEWHMYKDPAQKTLKIRRYIHQKYKSHHAKRVSELANK